MDIRRDGFWATLSLNNKSLLLNGDMCITGSIMFLVSESLKAIQAERSRLNADGELQIVLRIAKQPINATREGVMLLGKSEEVAALLESELPSDQPCVGETYEEFYQRLIDLDYPQISAEYIAAEWFNREVSPETTLWLNDPKALRFRVLNSRDEEFEAALPVEYESLKNYVKTTYPEFVENLVFRTA